MGDGQRSAEVETSYGVNVHGERIDNREPDPERGYGGGFVGDEAHLNEQLTRRRHARYAAIGFIIATWILLSGVIISIVCLLYRLFGVYTADQAAGSAPDAGGSGDTAVAAQLADISVVTHVLPALPIFSLSIFALLVYITLARFTKHFVSESTARESAQEDMTDDSVILTALDKVSQLFKQGRK